MSPFTESLYSKSMYRETEVRIDAKETLKYQHGRDCYPEFTEKYNKIDSQEWMSRKILAIPRTFSGIVKSVAHLALAVWYGMGFLTFKTERSKINAIRSIHCFKRDLEEAGGNLVTLFNDRLGLFLIERADFQRHCYQAFNPAEASMGKYSELIQEKLKDTTLLEYKNFPPLEQRCYSIAYYGPSLGRAIWILESKGIDIKKFFQESSDDLLSKYTLEDLIFSNQSALKKSFI